MSRSKDIGHNWTTFDAIECFGAENGRVNADFARSPEFGRKVPVGVPSVSARNTSSRGSAHVTGDPGHVGRTVGH